MFFQHMTLTFDLDLHSQPLPKIKVIGQTFQTGEHMMNFGPMTFGPVNYGQVTDRQKLTHMSTLKHRQNRVCWQSQEETWYGTCNFFRPATAGLLESLATANFHDTKSWCFTSRERRRKANLWKENTIFFLKCPFPPLVVIEKCAGPADRKVRFLISPKNYTTSPYAYKALKIGEL